MTNSSKPTVASLIAIYKETVAPAVTQARFIQRVMTDDWDIAKALRCRAGHDTPLTLQCMEFFQSIPEEKRAVPYDTFYARVSYGWEMKRAISTPVLSQRSDLRKIYDAHQGEKVDFATFYYRVVKRKWTVVKALTSEKQPAKGPSKRTPARMYYEENKARAEVSLEVYFSRINQGGWSMEEALTRPKMPPTGRQKCSDRVYYDEFPNPQVSYRTFSSRVRQLKWTRDKAIRTPANPPVSLKNTQPRARRRISPEAEQYYVDNKALCKVEYKQYKIRVLDGWEPHRALNTPLRATKDRAGISHMVSIMQGFAF